MKRCTIGNLFHPMKTDWCIQASLACLILVIICVYTDSLNHESSQVIILKKKKN